MTALPEPPTMQAAWDELIDRELLTRSLGQPTCGYTTHDGLVGACQWCGAAV